MSILSAKLTAVAVVCRPLMREEDVLVCAGYEAGVTVKSCGEAVAMAAMSLTLR
jgi:hypothetical protein